MGLKHLIEKLEPHFTHGGKLEKYYPLYEAAATIFYTPGVTRGARARRHRPEADDDPRVVCRIPGDVLGHVQRWAADHSGATSYTAPNSCSRRSPTTGTTASPSG